MRWHRRVLAGCGALAAASCALPAAASAAAVPPAPSATRTTLASTAATRAFDSRVTFTAHVSASTGTPTGSVTLTDASNGTVLAVVRLRDGSAAFSAAGLAPGDRSIAARYAGSSTDSPSSSAAVSVRVGASSDAVTYQVDPRHDGDQARGGIRTRKLTRKWSVRLGGANPGRDAEAGDVSYPVIAGGRVFVTVENARGYGTVLHALDARTGAREWKAVLGGDDRFSALAYGDRRVFAINGDGVLTAFAAGTGRRLWHGHLPLQYGFSAPPTAYDGLVYVMGQGYGGSIYAVSEATGALRWWQNVEDGENSSPAVDDTGAYVSFACQHDYRFSLSGHLIWQRLNGCDGLYGSTAVLHGGFVYARGARNRPAILAQASGRVTGSFAADTAPAFDATTMYTLQNGKLVAVAAPGRPGRWTFSAGRLVTAPVVSNGVVFAGSSNGTVYGVSASSGARLWRGRAGARILGPDERNDDVLIGMAAGDGRLVVPAGRTLTAFGD
jgi:outer membrane protein assembly factor BamB